MDNPRPPKLPKTAVEKDTAARLYVVLEMAPLETIKVRMMCDVFHKALLCL